jgi:hypothetical protein
VLDRVKFAEVITMFCEMLGRAPLSKPSLEIYYQALQDMTNEEFTRSATRIVRERRFTSLPTPAEFLHLPDDADRGMLAAEQVLRAMERVGGDSDVTSESFGGDGVIVAALDQLGGWVAQCEVVSEFEVDKLGIWKRDFAAVYRTMSRRSSVPPRVLLGRHSQSNVTRGFLNPATGELRNALGSVVSVATWGHKQLSAAPIEPVSHDEGLRHVRSLTCFIEAADEVPVEVGIPK